MWVIWVTVEKVSKNIGVLNDSDLEKKVSNVLVCELNSMGSGINLDPA